MRGRAFFLSLTLALATHVLAGVAINLDEKPLPPKVKKPAAVIVSVYAAQRTKRTLSSPTEASQPTRILEPQGHKVNARLPSEPKAQPDDYFYPRSALSKVPNALSEPFIEIPAGFPSGQKFQTVISLFIDESGVVRKVEFADDKPFPEPMERSIRSAFMQTTYSPGEIQGTPVKSIIKIEMTFDDGSSPAPPANDMATTNGADRSTLSHS
ncbi:MAG: hypothetical protein KGI91_08665 [Burkholderiales bacterium]|nr:hypothetical protein [Burkholderiales bacterium]MDE2077128.1 hypothetical protein [Burkholderiales bacterium]MDE2433335.1 hypothetical protein [Burkholderiales bacterium]